MHNNNMKKILYLLLSIITFTACGGDDPDPIVEKTFDNWNDPANPHYAEYQGKYNPIKGEWQLIQRNGTDITDFLVYKFTDSFTLSEAATEPAEEKEPTYTTPKSYIINDKEYKIDSKIYSYGIAGALESAKLSIKEGNATLTFKPYESKVWSWKGDWNSPSDPHYTQYNGKYNPIKGTWKMTHVGGNAVVGNPQYYRFNDDFIVETSYSGNTGFQTQRKYWINDTGIKEDTFGDNTSYTYKYKIVENTLYYQAMLPRTGNLITFSKYK